MSDFTATVEFLAENESGISVTNFNGGEVFLTFDNLQQDFERGYYERGDEVMVQIPIWLAEEKSIVGDLE